MRIWTCALFVGRAEVVAWSMPSGWLCIGSEPVILLWFLDAQRPVEFVAEEISPELVVQSR